LITAVVRDARNNLVAGANVSFSSDSGEIRPVQIEGSAVLAGITDASGRAQARLTTATSKDNRTIVVTAKVSRPNGSVLERTISVDVTGTTLSISGSNSITTAERPTFTVNMRDSAGAAIANQTLRVTLTPLGQAQPNPLAEITTNNGGTAEITINTQQQGTYLLVVSKPDAPGIVSATLTLTVSPVSTDVLTIRPHNDGLSPPLLCERIDSNAITGDPNCRVRVNIVQEFKVNWPLDNITDRAIQLSTTRGELLINGQDNNTRPDKGIIPNGGRVNLDGVSSNIATGTFGVRSTSVGPAKISVQGVSSTGGITPVYEFTVEFIADEPHAIAVQANPPVIHPNSLGNTTQQSEIIAVVRDSRGNVVKGQTVNFSLQDITGGYLTSSAVETNSFGEATTRYIAGTAGSAANGVVITANVQGTGLSKKVELTVAQRSAFVSVASGNVIRKDDTNTRYILPHNVLVTDSNGTPVENAEVTLSIWVQDYFRPVHNNAGVTVGYALCKNEDKNRNGILDIYPDGTSEDIDNNGQLDPGGVITVDKLRITTDATGFADFNVVYAIQYAQWLKNVELMARALVSGTESTAIVPLRTPCSAEDAKNETCPVENPFSGVKPENFGGICVTCREEPDPTDTEGKRKILICE
jgi:adhesin/invasin